MLEDGKITQEQARRDEGGGDHAEADFPKTGCAASSAPYLRLRAVDHRYRPRIRCDAGGPSEGASQGVCRSMPSTLDLQLQKTVDKAMSKYTPTKMTMSGDSKSYISARPQ